MGIALGSILGGILGAAGGAGDVWNERAKAAQADKLARDKMFQEQQDRAAEITLRRDTLTENARQFGETQAGLSTPAGVLFNYIGVPLPAGLSPDERIPNTIGDNLIKATTEQQKVERDTAARLGQASLIRQSAQGVPAQLTGQLAPGEDPEAAAMIPRTAGTPPPENAQERILAAGLHEKSPLGAPLLEKILGLGEDTWKPVTPGATHMYDRGGSTRAIPGVVPKGKEEPPNYAYIHGALAEAGWRPDMKGYNTEFTSLLQQPVPIPEGGKATARTEGVRPPSFYGNQAPSVGAMPGTSPPRFQGEPAKMSETGAASIANAISVRDSTNQMYQALKNPEVVNNYIGPYAQYWSRIQGGAPYQALGEKPPDLISLEQNLANLENYTIRLITGAAVREAEEPRIRKQMPAMGNQPEEFKQKLTWTIKNNEKWENVVRTLAMQGNKDAQLAMVELGLDRLNVVDVTNPARPDFQINRDARVPPKVPMAGTRVRDPRTGKTGTVPPGELVPAGLEVIQ